MKKFLFPAYIALLVLGCSEPSNGDMPCLLCDSVDYRKCGNEWYNASRYDLRCRSNVIETKCGTDWYDDKNTDLSCKNNAVETRCGTGSNFHNPATQFCIGNDAYNRCDGSTYSPETQFCQSGSNEVKSLCGTQTYTSSQFCQSPNVIEPLCGTQTYLATEQCCGSSKYTTATQFCQFGTNAILSLCGTQTYASSQFCQSANVVKSLCGSQTYTASQRCENNVIETECGGNWHALNSNQRCQNNVIETKCGSGWYNTATLEYCSNGTIKTYKTIVIGTQTWMAENLNYNVNGSKCYSNSESNCDKYGRLYDWATAMALPSSCNSADCSGQVNAMHRGVCPSDWHLPSDAEWATLVSYVENDKGCSGCAGTHLKAVSGWNSYSGIVNLDSYGFSALPGGFGNSSDYFNSAGYYSYWWSASEYNGSYAYYMYMYYNYETYLSSIDKNGLYSIRCLRD